MKLSKQSLIDLELLLQTGITAGIEKMIIDEVNDKQVARGRSSGEGQNILITDKAPDLEGAKMGINNIQLLSQRINLVKNSGEYEIEATISPNKVVTLLELSQGKTKTQFRCTSPDIITTVPKQIKDTMSWSVNTSKDTIMLISQAISAMGGEFIKIASKDSTELILECSSSTNDLFSTSVSDCVEYIGSDDSSSFYHEYNAKSLLALFKEAVKTANTFSFEIGENGILSIKLNELNFFILPKA